MHFTVALPLSFHTRTLLARERLIRKAHTDKNVILTNDHYEAGKPTPVLQSSTFSSGARDYRINAAEQTYITNFKTLKKPLQYTVEILRDALSIGKFGFQTTK